MLNSLSVLCMPCLRLNFDVSIWLQDPTKTNDEESIMSITHCSDSAYNFILLQKLTSLLGDFPEVTV